MPEAKNAPGSWRAIHRPGETFGPPGTLEVVDEHDESITDPYLTDEDAHLIAAAPDLLAAVEELAAEADQALAYISTRTDADARAAQLEGSLMQAIDASRAIAEQARGGEEA